MVKKFNRRKLPVNFRWKLDKTYIKVNGQWLIKKRVRAMQGFKTFNSAQLAFGGVELVHMLRKGQLMPRGLGHPLAAAEQFYQLVA